MIIYLNEYSTPEEAKKDPSYPYTTTYVEDVKEGIVLTCGFCKEDYIFNRNKEVEDCPLCGNDIVFSFEFNW